MSESRMGEHAEQMREDAGKMGQDIGQTAEEMRGTVSEMAGRAKQAVSDYGRRGYDYASEQGRMVKDRTEQYIHENPWYAIGIALGAGVLLGMLLKSAASRD